MCGKHLPPGLTTGPPLNPRSGKEKADSHKLSPDTRTHILAHKGTCIHTHTLAHRMKCNKKWSKNSNKTEEKQLR